MAAQIICFLEFLHRGIKPTRKAIKRIATLDRVVAFFGLFFSGGPTLDIMTTVAMLHLAGNHALSGLLCGTACVDLGPFC